MAWDPIESPQTHAKTEMGKDLAHVGRKPTQVGRDPTHTGRSDIPRVF